jgi:hypothetical protein
MVILLLGLMTATHRPMAGQEDPTGTFMVLLPGLVGRDGATPNYSGIISWVNQEGDGTESVSAYVSAGRVQCKGSYHSPDGTNGIDGPGLLEIYLGLEDGKYTFRVACPNAISKPAREASWEHSWDSYKQPGGAVRLDERAGKAILPALLEGSWQEPYDDGGSIRMTWQLCGGCKPPAPPSGPPSSF